MSKKLLSAILACGLIGAGFLIYGPAQAVSLNFPNPYQISFTGTNINPDADLDALGNVYAVYERGGSIYYKMNRGAEQLLVAIGANPDLAVDSAGNAHVAYLSSSDVMYTKLTAGAWSVPVTVAAGNYATIDTDSSNYAYIAYSVIGGDGYSDVVLAENSTGAFASAMVKDGSLVLGVLDENYTAPNIKIDANNKYHIAFIYTNNAGAGESYVQIESDGDGDSTSAAFTADSVGLGKNSLALDGSNNAYIAFTQNPLAIKYAKVATSWTWTETPVISLMTGGGLKPAIAVNGATIGVAYTSGVNVKYKEDTGAGFGLAETIDTGSNPVVLLGSHFAYYEKSGNIYLATDQSIADSNPPVVSGVIEGGLYNTSKTITFADDEAVPAATLDGAPFASNDTVSTDGAHVLIVTDGTNPVTINFTIDTIAPTVTGLTEGTTYTSAITGITFSDGTALLAGPSESAPTSPFDVSTNGAWILTVTDLAGNKTIINFTVAIPTPVTPPATTGGGGGGGGGPVDPTIYAYNQSLAVDGTRPGVLTWNFNPSVTAKLEVPAGAVAASTVFKIETAPLNEYGQPISSLGAILIGNQAFKIAAYDANNLPVTNFLKPLKITLAIDGIKVNLTDLGAYYFNAQTAQWQKISDAVFDQINGTAVFSADHLGIFAVYKVANLPATLATTAIPVVLPVVPGQVLGAAYCGDYKNGELIRNAVDKKIYVLINGYKSHITTLAELRAKYAGQVINNVGAEVIACYPNYTGQVLGAEYAKYPDGALIRNAVNFRIYVIKDGKKLYIPTLDELRAHYAGIKINNLAPAEVDLYPNF